MTELSLRLIADRNYCPKCGKIVDEKITGCLRICAECGQQNLDSVSKDLLRKLPEY